MINILMKSNRNKNDGFQKKAAVKLGINAKPVCKPSSVLNGHLSRRIVAYAFKRLRSRTGRPLALFSCTGRGLHGQFRRRTAGALLPRLFTLAKLTLRGTFLLHFP